jgi:hypothetical protein
VLHPHHNFDRFGYARATVAAAKELTNTAARVESNARRNTWEEHLGELVGTQAKEPQRFRRGSFQKRLTPEG